MKVGQNYPTFSGADITVGYGYPNYEMWGFS